MSNRSRRGEPSISAAVAPVSGFRELIRERWEYRREILDPAAFDVEAGPIEGLHANTLGADGWELVHLQEERRMQRKDKEMVWVKGWVGIFKRKVTT